MIGAFAYLILTATRNRLTGKLRRLRNPRYALAVLLGLSIFTLSLGVIGMVWIDRYESLLSIFRRGG